MTSQDASPVPIQAPGFFLDMLRATYGSSDVNRILDGCDLRRQVTLRANTIKATRDQVGRALDEAGISWRSVPWYPDAFVITDAREHNLWDLPIYQEGGVYLQSLSSMMPPLVVGLAAGLDVLDMCAAPGGKTCQMATMGGPRCHITACEMHAPRADKLEYNLAKQGATNVTVMRADARRLDDFFSFDRILLDAPCSGSGTLRLSDPKTAKHFTERLVDKSVKSQRALLDKALRLLKPGGVLLYSTCSVLKCENEDQVKGALARARKDGVGSFKLEPVVFNVATDTNVPSRAADNKTGLADIIANGTLGLPLLPSDLPETVTVCPTEEYEGFFVARIRRTA